MSVDRLTNLLVEFDKVPDLEFKQLPGFRCSVPKLTFDFSETKNAPNFSLPTWYTDSLKVIDKNLDTEVYGSALWEGVYIPKITIEIPKSFQEGATTEVVPIVCNDLIVDESGITALAKASEVLDGNLKGFKYEVDSLRINVIANKLSKAGFYGLMAFPICKEESSVGYGLTISKSLSDGELSYDGYADLNTNLYAEAFGLAQIGLTGCKLDFQYRNKQFFPKVDIDGSLTISPKKKDSNSSEPAGSLGLEFNSLLITSSAPYIDVDVEGYVRLKGDGGNSKIANLPISIKDPEFIKSQGGQRIGLGMTLNIHLQNSNGEDNASGNGFSGEADFTVWTKRNPTNNRWKYDDFDLNSVKLAIENGAFNLRGSLSMFDGDNVYGKGFCGDVEVDIVDMITVKSAIIFGKVTDSVSIDTREIETAYLNGNSVAFASNDETQTTSTGKKLYRYWFADGAVKFSPGITVASGVDINSFTGGLYYNMAMVDPDSSLATTIDCQTVSGRTYKPDDQYFGVIAGIGLQSTGGGNAYNGNINFGVELNKNGGINKIATWGGVGFVTFDFKAPEVTKVAESMDSQPVGENTKSNNEGQEPEEVESSVKANWYVEYDFPNRTLVGDFDIYMNVAGVLKGLNDGKAGRISVYSSPGTWYVHVGKPIENEMLGIDVLSLAEIGGYMCFGNTLPNPAIAAMPPEISPSINIDYNLLGMGGGLSFGSRLTIGDNPGLNLGLCDARVELGFVVKSGFDILLSQSTKEVYCAGSDKARGVNNWYATGQAYLYGQAGLRLKWSCWLLGSGNEDILSIFMSSYVFAQLPKPTFFIGEVNVGFRCLKKNWSKNFKLEFGDRCVSNTLDNEVNFIEAIDPSEGQNDVPTGKSINVYFSNPVLNFEYALQGQESKTKVYRAYIDNNGVEVSTPSGDMEFTYEMSEDFTKMVITPRQAYPGNTPISVTVTVTTQVKNDEDKWENTEKTETKTITFNTVEDPGYIPVNDIYYAYPLPEMQNFYKNESTEGFIRLAVLPNKAVELIEDYEFNIAIYENQNEVDRSSSISYNDTYGEHNFTFNIPTIRMDPGKNYTLKIMKSPVPTHTKEGYTEEESLATGTVDPGRGDTVILEYDFKTSKYASFNEKMSLYSTSFSETFNGVISANLSINDLKSSGASSYEPLSEAETTGYISEGNKKSEPLLQFGNVGYDNPSLDRLKGVVDSFGSVNLKNLDQQSATAGYATVTGMLDDLNTTLKDMNMNCLVSGGCSSSDLKNVKIPAGKFVLPVGYYLPGQTTPTSTYNIVVDLENDLVLPQ